MSWIEKKSNFTLEDAGQVHLPKKATSILFPSYQTDALIFITPKNGDPMHGYGKNLQLFPDTEFCHKDCEFMNAGVVLFRYSTLTHKFLDEWWDELIRKRFLSHPWEQPRLSEVAVSYSTHVEVIPFLEAKGPQGKQIRHLWLVNDPKYKERQLVETSERQEQMHLAILGLLALQEEDYLTHSPKENRGQ